jgi:hypothetical protein
MMNPHSSIDRKGPVRFASSFLMIQHRVRLAMLLAILTVTFTVAADTKAKSWTDNDLVASYHDLDASGALLEAVLSPSLPDEPPQEAFMQTLAWLASGAPSRAGSLNLADLDAYIGSHAQAYISLLSAKVDDGVDNDYARTRTWKVIQKLTLLRNEISRPENAGSYRFPAIARAPGGDDPWEREHTLGSTRDFKAKVCRASYERPVLVKFGNTNCTQCMLFEITGSVKAFAESPSVRGVADVYKVWWGLEPDASFAGRISNPHRLDELVRAEGVHSSPTFIVYRNGRQYPCSSAFPSGSGSDGDLEACIRMQFADKPPTGTCSSEGKPASASGF